MQNASPYLSAEALGITDGERKHLIALLGPLSADALAFDMNCTGPSFCNSACCIGGHVALRMGYKALGYRLCFRDEDDQEHPYLFSDVLESLYYPEDFHPAWEASASQAAIATSNFLMGVADPWGFMAEPRAA